jgi:hypothetical protein
LIKDVVLMTLAKQLLWCLHASEDISSLGGKFSTSAGTVPRMGSHDYFAFSDDASQQPLIALSTVDIDN